VKSDTQGYDLEVLKGAEGMFRENAIKLVYSEIIFSNLYKDMPSFGQMYDFLITRGFRLVSFYEVTYEDGLASWTDGLFAHQRYASRRRHSRSDSP